ncbi:MAG: VWA domain-containing protein [Thiotrichaceae bacterium]
MNIEFALPWVFWLLPLPVLVALLFPRAPVSTPAALRIPFFEGMQGSFRKQQSHRSRIWLWLAALAWLALVVSAARPQLVGETIHMPISSRSLMMAVDISGSMQNEDMSIKGRLVSRLTAVKAVAGDFIKHREGDRIGLILFGSNAYLQAPLTLDRKTVSTLLGEAQLGLAGRRTAIGDAIGLAVKRLREQPEENRVLILLTDGANTAGSIKPLKAADLAAQEKVRIYTIGVGSDGGVIRTPFGVQRMGKSDLDEPVLTAIASKTTGEYFRARDVEGLKKIYALLDKMEPVSKDDMTYRPVDELYYWPLALALLLSVLVVLGVNGSLLRIVKGTKDKEKQHA